MHGLLDPAESRSIPIGDYGLLGDTRSAALVAPDGAIDWMCIPTFDGQPVFGRLVGGAAAGSFRMGPAGPAHVVARAYHPRTATLETTWSTASGRLTLAEGMLSGVEGRLLPTTLLVRRLTAADTPVDAVVELDPRLGESHRPPRWRGTNGLLVCSWSGTALAARTAPLIRLEPGRRHSVTVRPGEPLTAVVGIAHREPVIDVNPVHAWELLVTDERSWQRWSADADPDLPDLERVIRSLITLRLLTYSPSGAPVAAPTTSLPEQPGGERNWDYRYAWPRDASIGVGAFLGVGQVEEARHFLAWLLHASRLDRPRLPVLFDLHGRRPRPERTWKDWEGYAGSRPVRVGNGAVTQHQLDGYGWVLDAAWLLTAASHRLYSETWRAMRGLADEVARRWRDPDAGIWEIRSDATHHVHSKLMAWLALDRALRIAVSRGAPARQIARWRAERDAIHVQVAAHGFDAELGSYTRAYDSRELDAAVLILPLIGIEPARSPRVIGTVDAIRRHLGAGGPLLYRYPPGHDGIPGGEGAFLPCSFWLAQALAATGRSDDALDVLTELHRYGGALGLLSEEVDPATDALLGNYPQALSHAAHVQAALAIRDATARTPRPSGPVGWPSQRDREIRP